MCTCRKLSYINNERDPNSHIQTINASLQTEMILSEWNCFRSSNVVDFRLKANTVSIIVITCSNNVYLTKLCGYANNVPNLSHSSQFPPESSNSALIMDHKHDMKWCKLSNQAGNANTSIGKFPWKRSK